MEAHFPHLIFIFIIMTLLYGLPYLGLMVGAHREAFPRLRISVWRCEQGRERHRQRISQYESNRGTAKEHRYLLWEYYMNGLAKKPNLCGEEYVSKIHDRDTTIVSVATY